MDAAILLDRLTKRGIVVEAIGDNLAVGPSRLLTDTDRRAIRAHKPALLALVSNGSRVCADSSIDAQIPLETLSMSIYGGDEHLCENQHTDARHKHDDSTEPTPNPHAVTELCQSFHRCSSGGMSIYGQNHTSPEQRADSGLNLDRSSASATQRCDDSSIDAHPVHRCSSTHTLGGLSIYERIHTRQEQSRPARCWMHPGAEHWERPAGVGGGWVCGICHPNPAKGGAR